MIQCPPKRCAHCGKLMYRKRRPCGRLEAPKDYRRRTLCSVACMRGHYRKEVVSEIGRRKRAQRFRGTKCELCGTDKNLCIHHKNRDTYDNSTGNLMTLCNSCHSRWHHRAGHIPKLARLSLPGEKNPSAKLSAKDVKEIVRRIRRGETHQHIGDMFGVTRVAIRYIASGKTWATVTGIERAQIRSDR